MSDLGADRVPVGYVRRAHGIAGAVVLRPLTDSPDERFVVGARFNTDRDSPSELQVESVRAHKDGLLLAFAGISTRNEAESLRGITLTIARSERRDLDAGEYWEDDLIGLTAVDTSGVTLGIVASIVTGAAQDRLVVDTDAGPVEVPFVDAIVIDVAIADGRVVIDAPEGLF